MAWTSHSDRFSLRAGQADDSVGPGAYFSLEGKKADPSCAPFGTSAPRDRHGGEDTGPPPGAYNPKIPKGGYDSGLPRKHVPFSVGGQRSGFLGSETAAPGPGEYHSEKRLEALPCRTMGLPQTGKKSIFRSASAPSIPRGEQCHGYEESGDGRLVRQGPKDGRPHFTGAAGDTAGPGHYQVPSAFGVARGGRFLAGAAREPLGKSTEAPGPGHYASADSGLSVGGGGTRDIAFSASFVSTSPQRPGLHRGTTTGGAKGRKNRGLDCGPGPGQYYSDSRQQRSLRELHPELQYFGSTTERFRGPRADDAPGPASYSLRQRVTVKSDWGCSMRFSGQEQQAVGAAPGPGSYNPQRPPAAVTASVLGSTGAAAFGSMESRRGIADDKPKAPGPGAYHSGGEEERPRPAPRALAPRPAAKLVREKAPERPMPAPGAYDPMHSRDIAAVMRLPSKSEGFLSSAQRSAFGGDKARTTPGPGAYVADPGSVTAGKRMGTFNRTVAEGAPLCGRPKGLGFDTQTQRFRAQAGKEPGPGAYEVEHSWTKKNFNVRFGEV